MAAERAGSFAQGVAAGSVGALAAALLLLSTFAPDSTLVAYLNADHWALAVPIARTHDIVGEILVDRNDFPREALHEALLRFIEEDLQDRGN